MKVAMAATGLLAAVLAAGCANTTDQQSASTPSGGASGSGSGGGTGATAGGPTRSSGESSGAQQGGAANPGPGGQPVAVDPGTRCHSGDLRATLRGDGAAAGNLYATLILTNETTHTCRIYGYGGIGLQDAAHHPLPTKQVRNTMHKPVLVTLAPNQSASSVLHWGDVADGSEPETGGCEPQPAFLTVIPPDEKQPLTIPWESSPVCEHGQIDQWGYAPGIVRPS